MFLVRRGTRPFLISGIPSERADDVRCFLESIGYTVHGYLDHVLSSEGQQVFEMHELISELNRIEADLVDTLKAFDQTQSSISVGLPAIRQHMERHCKAWAEQLSAIRSFRDTLI